MEHDQTGPTLFMRTVWNELRILKAQIDVPLYVLVHRGASSMPLAVCIFGKQG
jgi:hypothetical protein